MSDAIEPTEDEYRQQDRIFQGMRLRYISEPLDEGWYYGPGEAGDWQADFGPFPDFAAARADITDRPLRDVPRYAGPYMFEYSEETENDLEFYGAGWRYEEKAGDPGCRPDFGPFPTLVAALAASRVDGAEAREEPETTEPPDQILGIGPWGGGIATDMPIPTDNFPPVLATLINEFDWRHHSEHLQKITRPFAALAFALARTDPHPFWTEKAMLALVYARYLAMKAWAYTEDPEAE